MAEKYEKLRATGAVILAVSIASCAGQRDRNLTPATATTPIVQAEAKPLAPTATALPPPGATTEIGAFKSPGGSGLDARPEPKIKRGSGEFLRMTPPSPKARSGGDEFKLNFEATDLQEVVKAILGDLLKENYFLDPRVTGSVTLQTSRPLSRDDLLPTLENLLRMNGAALLRSGNTYRVVPQGEAARGNVPPLSGRQIETRPGYGMRIMPLRYVAAKEVHKLIQPFLPPDSPAIIDEQRNLLILTGTEQELSSLAEMVGTFDVDYLNGMSIGLFKLESSEAKALAGELEKIFGDKDSPVGGMVRVVPIERLNSVMVISPRPHYLNDAREWIERLDQLTDSVEPRLYVYRVQNAKAKDLAAVLGGLFGGKGEGTDTEAPPPSVAPGEQPTQLGAEDPLSSGLSGLSGQQTGGRTGSRISSAGGVSSVVSNKNLKIIADDSNNSLVIMATPSDYKMIENALRSLDVVPLQVHIEASVIEVSLNDNLQYGVEWKFNHDIQEGTNGGAGRKGIFQLGALAEEGALAAASGGFSYLVQKGSDINVLLNALAQDTKLNVLSSPSLMVLDNQTATIKVVDQIPVVTQQQQSLVGGGSTSTTNNTLLASVQFKDAGVILEVTPRVNAGGRITMELEQDVTDQGAPVAPSNNSSFLQRNIKSTITVQSGETIVLGGLIKNSVDQSRTGIPFLKDIPLLGNLFSSTTDNVERTELLVLIKPTAVRNDNEAKMVTDEFRDRLRSLNATPTGGAYKRYGTDYRY